MDGIRSRQSKISAIKIPTIQNLTSHYIVQMIFNKAIKSWQEIKWHHLHRLGNSFDLIYTCNNFYISKVEWVLRAFESSLSVFISLGIDIGESIFNLHNFKISLSCLILLIKELALPILQATISLYRILLINYFNSRSHESALGIWRGVKIKLKVMRKTVLKNKLFETRDK
ncbi:hypothetical protein RirG_005080 [Rhizophagus irregularis DAOM 197198w]|uniref:Uncharacterized protein n=1 Tax=Rhizophagus irregularis (strain DAOM 197198w) TaxID=1432141 RepID=A0A015LIF8_RHIIW|nr:hypothetical protein RirG_005080 [Rhizophagus irregularis DAOM 197198w]